MTDETTTVEKEPISDDWRLARAIIVTAFAALVIIPLVSWLI